MSIHTPGPWIAEPEEASEHRGIAITAPANGWIVATILPDDGRAADDVDWANAHLIAAAPELLEALKEAVAYIRTVELLEMMPYTAKGLEAANRADIAIGKAERRT